MKKKQVQRLRYAAAFLICAAVGAGGSCVWHQAAQPADVSVGAPNAVQAQAEGIQVRVRGGVAEWFDGVRWNTAGALEQLEQQDPTAVRSETWQLLAQQRTAAKQQQRQSALTQLSREANALTTGQKPAAQTTPSRRPAANTTPAPATPAPTTPTTPTPEPPAPTVPPQNEPEPVPSGDGENMDGGGLWG